LKLHGAYIERAIRVLEEQERQRVVPPCDNQRGSHQPDGSQTRRQVGRVLLGGTYGRRERWLLGLCRLSDCPDCHAVGVELIAPIAGSSRNHGKDRYGVCVGFVRLLRSQCYTRRRGSHQKPVGSETTDWMRLGDHRCPRRLVGHLYTCAYVKYINASGGRCRRCSRCRSRCRASKARLAGGDDIIGSFLGKLHVVFLARPPCVVISRITSHYGKPGKDFAKYPLGSASRNMAGRARGHAGVVGLVLRNTSPDAPLRRRDSSAWPHKVTPPRAATLGARSADGSPGGETYQ
jgi:hypothetical protein